MYRKAIKEMALDELRSAREFTRAELSQVLKVDRAPFQSSNVVPICISAPFAVTSRRWAGAFKSVQSSRMERFKSSNLRMPSSTYDHRCSLRASTSWNVVWPVATTEVLPVGGVSGSSGHSTD